MPERPRLVGINHIALDVGDLDAALEFYGAIFEFSYAAACPGWRSSTWATSSRPSRRVAASRADDGRHFGLVVNDMEAAQGRS